MRPLAVWYTVTGFCPITNLSLVCRQISVSSSFSQAFSPHWIYWYFKRFGTDGWRMLGSVMLAVTGTEAMFADLGHFNISSVVVNDGVVDRQYSRYRSFLPCGKDTNDLLASDIMLMLCSGG